MIIIGITGTQGSGKGSVVKYLQEKYDFKHYSARAFISEEVVKRGLPEIRDNMRVVANELRATHGSSYIAEQLYEQAIKGGGNAILESLRSVGEIEALRIKPQPFFLLAVDADPQLRYDRVVLRKSSTDNISFEKFLEEESLEMNDNNPSGMNLIKCMSMADAKIENNKDIKALETAVDAIVQTLIATNHAAG